MTRSLPFALVLALAPLLAGCANDLAGPEGTPLEEATASSPAAELPLAALVPATDPSAARAAAGPRVLVLFSSTLLDPQAFLRRYSFLRRYAFLRRYGSGGSALVYGVSAEMDLRAYALEYCTNGAAGGEDECDDDLDEEAIATLEADDDVVRVDRELPLTLPPNPLFQQGPGTQLVPWGITRVGAEGLALPPGALDGVDLYVFDTALGTANDLDVAEQANYGGGTRPSLHGTYVAGAAAAVDDADGVVGVAPGVTVRSFAVLNARGQTQLTPAILALEEVRRRRLLDPSRPVVVNMSFGGNAQTTVYNALDEAVEAAVAAGVVVVVAAGNEGINAELVTPAHVAGALTIGAYDVQDRFASFSNYGPVVDLLAPGVDVLSLGLRLNGTPGRAVGSGTSVAAPHVAGAAALFLALNPSATPAEVAAALVAAGQPAITGVPSGTTNKTVWVGDLRARLAGPAR